jgi:hypothetical protein
MFESFLDAITSVLGAGASLAGDYLAPAADAAGGAAEFTPELSALGMAGTDVVSSAPSVAESVIPSLISAGADVGTSEFGQVAPTGATYAPDIAASNAAYTPSGPTWSLPQADAGLVSEPAGPYGFDQTLASEAPAGAAGAAPPPTAWESVQQIPGKWWQGAQDAAINSPIKTLATLGGLGTAAYAAANPMKPPQMPSFRFGPVAAPRAASQATDIPGGGSRSPIFGNRGGGMKVQPSTGLKKAGGFGI